VRQREDRDIALELVGRKDRVGSMSFLILISASRTIGPQVSRSTWYVSTLGFSPVAGS